MSYQNQSLAQLKIDCQQEIELYHKTFSTKDGSLCCLEIVRRAAAHAQDALGALLEISRPFILAKCTGRFYEQREDIAQLVSIRLIGKFGNKENPFQVANFAGYRNYVNFTTRSIISNLIRMEKNSTVSMNEMQESDLSNESDMAEQLTRQEQAQLVLELLTDPLEREAILRRHVSNQSIDEIVAALSLSDPQITKRQVSRLLERGKKRLRSNPHLRHLIES